MSNRQNRGRDYNNSFWNNPDGNREGGWRSHWKPRGGGGSGGSGGRGGRGGRWGWRKTKDNWREDSWKKDDNWKKEDDHGKMKRKIRELELSNMDLEENVKQLKLQKRNILNDMKKENEENDSLQSQIKILRQKNENLEKELNEKKVGEPVYFSFFEKKNSIERITSIEILEKFLKKNEKNINSVNERIMTANERIRNRIGEIKLATTQKNEKILCDICCERQKNTLIDPCGHTLCKDCSEKLADCPFCRVKIERRMKVFI